MYPQRWNISQSIGQFPCVIKAGSDLLAPQVGELGDDLLRVVTRRKITKNEADRYPHSLDPWFAA